MGSYIIVTTTIDDETKSRELARLLVEQKLAACVQIVPITSTYAWQGKIETAKEYRLDAKTRGDLAEQTVDFIKKNHSYEVPEVVITPIQGGSGAYLKWLDEETR